MKKLVASILIFAGVYIATVFLVQQFVLRTFNVVQIEGVFPVDSRIFFRSANGFHPILSETTVGTVVPGSDESRVVTLQLSNRLVKKFHVELVHGGSAFRLQRISLYSFFGAKPVAWHAKEIPGHFDLLPNHNQTATTFDVKHSISATNRFFQWGIPLLIASLITLIFQSFRWRDFPSVRDTRDSSPLRSSDNIAALDGLRGLAALLVVFHHASGTFPGSGALGVWLFFVLSGFLLTRGFVTQPEVSTRPGALMQFVHRRFNRIVPMYFVFVTITYLFQGHYASALRHFLFVQGDGHLWTIINEMYFYLLLPFLGLCLGWFGRGRVWVSIAFLGFCAIAWRFWGTEDVLAIYALGSNARVYLEVFIIGMAGACWYFCASQAIVNQRRLLERYSGFIGLVLLAIVIFLSLDIQAFTFHQLTRRYPMVAAVVTLAMLLTAVTCKRDSLYRRLLQNPLLRFVGIIGYSFYLLHPTVLHLLHGAARHFLNVPPQNIASVWWIISTVLVTALFASFTYSFIERPFLRKAVDHKNTEKNLLPGT